MTTVYADRFAGRTAIITGGASGLGKAVAKRIVTEGGAVCLWDLNADALAEAKGEVAATHVIALDVSDAAAVQVAAGKAPGRSAGGSTSWSARPGSPAPLRLSTSIRSTAGFV